MINHKCFFIPIGYLVLANKKGYSLKTFFIEVFLFFYISNILRMLIIQAVFGNNSMSLNFIVLHSIILCFLASIFEEIGKRISFGSLLNKYEKALDKSSAFNIKLFFLS